MLEAGTFHLAFNTDALPLSSTGHVISARPVSGALLEVGTFHLAFNTNALPLSSTGHVALARPASIHVVALHLKEPLEDLLIPHLGSTKGVHSDFALCFTELKESWRLPIGAR